MFVKPGEKAQKRNQQPTHSYLDEASDWTLTTDLDGKLRVPREVADTQLRPDMILISRKTKRIGIVELTVPGEERIEVSGELKRAKYSSRCLSARRIRARSASVHAVALLPIFYYIISAHVCTVVLISARSYRAKFRTPPFNQGT